jgi:hypothetical protein
MATRLVSDQVLPEAEGFFVAAILHFAHEALIVDGSLVPTV